MTSAAHATNSLRPARESRGAVAARAQLVSATLSSVRTSMPRPPPCAPLHAVTVVAILLLVLPSRVLAQHVKSDFWVTNGTVYATAMAGNTLYLGGTFNYVGPYTGGGVPLSAVGGTALPGFPKVAQRVDYGGFGNVRGTVRAVVADGSGGWFIGGVFDTVGGLPRANLAHIRSDLTVAPWAPAISAAIGGLSVDALAVSGSIVYVGGLFSSIGGQTRVCIAALDAATGLATSWSPNASQQVRALTVSGSTVYAGGDFTNIAGQPRNGIAAIDAATGLATSWNPNANGVVRTLTVSGSTVYAGGGFGSIGGQTRGRIAALDATTGLATSWSPTANDTVRALVVSGSTVYAGGDFSAIGGQPRIGIAALDATTGLATSWITNANNQVDALVVSGSTVYAGGVFTSIGGQTRNRIAALDATTGLATSWDPNASDEVRALAVGGGTVYAGGDFISTGGQTRNNIAALDATSGLATSWNPNASSVVYALAVSGGTVYAGGNFLAIGGQVRSAIAALDAATGLATSWNPNSNGYVFALLVSGSTVYAGGSFATIGGQTRWCIAELDSATGLATSWDPHAEDIVFALAKSGSTVYAGGYFTVIGGQPRNRIAALDAATGLATNWDPDAGGGGPSAHYIGALAVSGSTVYAGGFFNNIGGQPHLNIAALDATTGLASNWGPSTSGTVWVLGLSGSTVYAGGSFSMAGPPQRYFLAAFDAATGLATSWNPNASHVVYALTVSGSTVYAGGSFTNMGGVPSSGIAAISAVGISQIQPSRGGDGGPVTVVLLGTDFQNGATAKLARSGQSDILGTQVAVAPDHQSLTATFDLGGKALGVWDVIVTDPDLSFAILPLAFTIEADAPHQLRVDVLGPAKMRPNRRKAFDVVIENLGNGDVLNLPLWISRIPVNATVELDFALASPPRAGGEPDWSTAPLTFGGPGGKYLALVIPRLPPGTSVRRIYLTVPNPVTSFTLDAALAPPWVDGAVFRDCLSSGGVITAPSCMGSQLTAINAYLATTPGVQALSGIGLWAKIAWQCEGAASLPAALDSAERVLDFMLQVVEQTGVPAGCEVALAPRWQDRRVVTIVTSVDPNEKLGAGGVGVNRQIGSEQILPYSIRFENLQTATAPAQEVVVIDALDGATLDLNTVIVSAIKFGKRANGLPWPVEPLPGLSSDTKYVDLRPEQNLFVRVGFNFDRATGVLAWSLSSIDPATGLPPVSDLVGFLPPNITPPEGEGSLLFTVLPKPGLTGGTSIRNRATINFDGDTLQTPEWSNRLDTTPPGSAVLPLGVIQDSASFTVRWAASGSPPDLHDFSVYVSQNGGAFRPWRLNTTATADTIRAPGGGAYSFYSLARDSSGNLEPVPSPPYVQTFSRVAVEDGARPPLALEGAVPNPATGEARVWFTLPSREHAVLEVMDVAGRRVLRREVGQLGPGRHSVDVSASVRAPGLYFLRFAQAGHVLRARMAVIR